MAAVQDVRRALISAQADPNRRYGAVESTEVEGRSDGSLTPVNERADNGSGKVDVVQEGGKKFREIWVLCLGLFSA